MNRQTQKPKSLKKYLTTKQGRLFSIILLALCLLTTVGLYWLFTSQPNTYIPSESESNVYTFTGTINDVQDCTSWIGGASCTWVVSGDRVTRTTGSSLEAISNTGKAEGLNYDESDIGKTVEVHAQRTGHRSYELTNSGHYIVVK